MWVFLPGDASDGIGSSELHGDGIGSSLHYEQVDSTQLRPSRSTTEHIALHLDLSSFSTSRPFWKTVSSGPR